MFVIVYSGAGRLLIFISCISLIACNLELFIQDGKDAFDQINFWLPCLVNAIAAWLLADYAKKLRTNPKLGNVSIRAIMGTEESDSVYWIPVKAWTWIFLAISVWQFIKK